MRLGEIFETVADGCHAATFDNIRRSIPEAWIECALSRCVGIATMRKRRLPAEQVIWLVLGMALMRDRPIKEVVAKLDLALPDPHHPTVAPSAAHQARFRLGEEPMAYLFRRCGDAWAHQSASMHRWRGLSLYGVDGTTIRVPDSPANRDYFGGTDGHRGPSGYPMVRVVALMALRSHLLADVCFGPYAKHENRYAANIWTSVPNHSLTAVDRGFFGAESLLSLSGSGSQRHWLTRAHKNNTWRVIERHSAGDALIEMNVSPAARKKNPKLPRTWQMRAITYERPGFAPQTLLTSLTDASYPADEIVALYHERWELEMGFDEIKTEMLHREECIRSRHPAAVAQELWGIFLVYNLVRLEMERIAVASGVEPTRISFVTAYLQIRDEWLWSALASPGAIPKHLTRLRENLKRFILPPRRRRNYPRVVKVKMSNYEKKRSNFAELQLN